MAEEAAFREQFAHGPDHRCRDPDPQTAQVSQPPPLGPPGSSQTGRAVGAIVSALWFEVGW